MSPGAGFSRSKSCSKSRKKGVADARLDSIAKSVRQRDGRSRRFRHQRYAGKLLGGTHRVSKCRWSVTSKAAGVDMVASSYAGRNGVSVHYEGLQTCGSVWACPCCSARISEVRRTELGHLLSWARKNGYFVRMVTLTCRHGAEDDLADLLLKLKGRSKSEKTGLKAYRGAKQRMVSDRRYSENIKPYVIGSVTATEVTGGGAAGWHPHMHMIMILREDIDFEPMMKAWHGALRAVGLDGTGNGWDVRSADETGKYLAKWGAAEELTLTNQKKGKGRTGRTPAQLLADSCENGDKRAGHLWAEYATVFHGRRQLVWSPKLKDVIGLKEIKDEEAAKDNLQDGQLEEGRTNIKHNVWVDKVANSKCDMRADLADMAEEKGVDQALAELIAGGVATDEELIDAEDEASWEPRSGGLAAQAMAIIQKRRDDGKDDRVDQRVSGVKTL